MKCLIAKVLNHGKYLCLNFENIQDKVHALYINNKIEIKFLGFKDKGEKDLFYKEGEIRHGRV